MIEWRRNTDRYMKCSSCRRTATRILINPDADVTVIYPPVVSGHGLSDDVRTHKASVSTCEAHLESNIRACQAKQSATIDRRPKR